MEAKMADAQRYIFSLKEIAEALIKKQGIHEGNWGLYLEFGISGTNIMNEDQTQVLPAAIVPITKMGLQKFDAPNPLTVDAAKANPGIGKQKKKEQPEAKKSA